MEALRHSKPICFLPFFHHARVERREFDILGTLDEGWCAVGRFPWQYIGTPGSTEHSVGI